SPCRASRSSSPTSKRSSCTSPGRPCGTDVRVALVVAGKELRRRLRDRTAIFLAFVAPSILAAIITGAFGGGFGTAGRFDLPVAVADLDHTPLSSAFVTDVLGSRQLRDQVHVHKVKDVAEARSSLRHGFDAAYVIPK